MKIITFRLVAYLKFSLIFTMLFSIGNLYAQNVVVSGTVTYNQVPIAGVTIRLKHNDKFSGTTTDSSGSYRIGISVGDVLVFSHIGYKTEEIRFINQSRIDMTLEEDVEQLASVELSGAYYSFDERTRTGNVIKVNTEQLQQQVIHSPMEALQGRVAGLEIETRTGLSGQAPLVTLRGQGSIRSFSDIPLFVIDGIPINNSGLSSLSSIYDGAVGIDPLATLDPALIESMEVLKDADATAIYGSRGANGVIIINTKRGKAGKTKFELQTETGVSWVGKFMELMDTEQYLKMRREAFENDGVTPTQANAPDLLLWDQNRYTDWQKELIGGNAVFKKYQASINGGNAQTSFLLSGGFQKEGTVFPGDFGFQNNNIYANINHRSEDNKLQLSTSINYGYRKSNLFNAGIFFHNAVIIPPNAPVLFDKQGNVNWELDEFGNPTFSNPMAGLGNPNVIKMQSLHWNGNLCYEMLKGLEVKLNLGINQTKFDDKELYYLKNFNPIYLSYAKSLTNNRLVDRNHFIIEPQVDYSINFDNHKIKGLVGSTFQKNKNSEKYLRGQGYFSESQVGNIALAQNGDILLDAIIDYRYAALFGRIGYSYANKYHLNLTGRRDGSSRFGEKNRFGNFGAIGSAWEFYKEDYIIDNWEWLSYGKLRGSIGTTGSDHIGDYQYLDTYNTITSYSGSLSKGGIIPSKLYDPHYQWEKNTKLEIALDVGLWNDKILLSSSWYRERSGNQLIGLSLPSTTGFTSVQGNFPATVENTGWEFVLQTTPIHISDFVWNSNVNFTLPKNRLISFPNLESSIYASQYETGKSLNIRKLYRYTGINSDTGKHTFEDINVDGALNAKDRVVIADLSRKFFGGWYNNLQYKNWNMSFLFEFVKQNGRNPITNFGAPGSRANMPIEVLDRWQTNNSAGTYQGFTQNFDTTFSVFNNSTESIVDASFIRMKSLSLNYQFSSSILQKLRLQQAQVYLKTQNLFTITSYKGYDPQNPIANIDLPALTSVHFGLKLTI